jgi:hypothetical protein
LKVIITPEGAEATHAAAGQKKENQPAHPAEAH